MKASIVLLSLAFGASDMTESPNLPSLNKELLEATSSSVESLDTVLNFQKRTNLDVYIVRKTSDEEYFECKNRYIKCSYLIIYGDKKQRVGFSITMNELNGGISFEEADFIVKKNGWIKQGDVEVDCIDSNCDYTVRYKKGNSNMSLGVMNSYPETIDVAVANGSSNPNVDFMKLNIGFVSISI